MHSLVVFGCGLEKSLIIFGQQILFPVMVINRQIYCQAI
jgi:hypothetical protein